MRKSIEATIEEIVQPIVDAKNFEIVDIEYGEYYLRVYLDKEGGISLSDCEVVSRELSEILDKKAFRVDKISKKIPKLDLLDKDNNKESIVMYLVCISFFKISLLLFSQKSLIFFKKTIDKCSFFIYNLISWVCHK